MGRHPIGEELEHKGLPYEQFLMHYQEQFHPEAHLEIGTYSGWSLAVMTCPTVAVDPKFEISRDVIGSKERAFFFQMTSDRFFERHDPTWLLGCRLDSAFLDGVHWFEFTLRDFINTERHCSERAVIFVHDCLPITGAMTERVHSGDRHDTGFTSWWTGDVWKLIPILKRYRPGLHIHCLDCWPTGLVAVTNLDPGNSILSEHYGEIVSEFGELQMSDEDLRDFHADCDILDSNLITSVSTASRLFR